MFLPEFATDTSTYSATRMRGYFFQAPVDFTVVQLRVPDEKAHGTQHAVIFKPIALPPGWSTPTYTPPLFYGTGPSANLIPCNVPIPIDTRQVDLSPDSLLFLSLSGVAPAIFQNYAGVLDAKGKATASLVLPNIPALTGVGVYTAFVTLLNTAPSGISDISPSFLLTIS